MWEQLLMPKADEDITRKNTDQCISTIETQNSSAKYHQIKYNNILKKLHIMIKWELSQACKVGSTFENQLIQSWVEEEKYQCHINTDSSKTSYKNPTPIRDFKKFLLNGNVLN